MCSVPQAALLLVEVKAVGLEEVLCAMKKPAGNVPQTQSTEIPELRGEPGGSMKLPGCGQVLGSPGMKRKEVGMRG